MSSLYNLEPQPTAKVLLETTSGDLLLELFAKQTPLASRNFLQLCLDGYYVGTIFHRLVPGFVIQGGDPTGTGQGGEAIYDGGLFEDEFHSRLKFNRRGLLGMANSGRKDDNGSQFFLTLGVTTELEGINTIFGRVVGDTIYNLMKMGEAHLMDGEGMERPLYPTKITGAEVLINPFDDMVRREGKGKARDGLEDKKDDKKKTKKKPGKKQLLSFGLEDGEDGEAAPRLKRETFNTTLISAEGKTGVGKEHGKGSHLAAKSTGKPMRRKMSRSRSPPLNAKRDPETQLPLPNNEEPSRSVSTSPEPVGVGKVSTLLDRTNAQIADLKASMKRNIPIPIAEPRKKSALEQMIPETSTRGRKRKHGVNGDASKDAQVLNILAAFQAQLDKAPSESDLLATPPQGAGRKQLGLNENSTAEAAGYNDEAELCDLHFIANCQSCASWDSHMTGDADAEDINGKGWMSHALSFNKDRLGKDLTWKRKNEEELVVIDPREKAKEISETNKASRSAKSAGNSNKTWAEDRDRGRLPEPDKRTKQKG